MFFVKVPDNGNRRNFIDNWMGYNHNYKINLGECFEDENLSSDLYPIMSPRNTRVSITNIDENDNGIHPTMRGIINTGGDVYVLMGNDLWNASTNVSVNLDSIFGDDETSEQTLIMMGAYILMFPIKAYFNVTDITEYGLIEATYEAPEGTTVTYTPCTLSGAALQNLSVSFQEPESPSGGDYWICTDPDKEGLYMYNSARTSFEAVATSHIKIAISGADFSMFNENDAVFTELGLPTIGESIVIEQIGSGYIVVKGFIKQAQITEVTTPLLKFSLRRKLPQMDYVCVDKNRVWGCHYGIDSGTHKIVNEIYASRLGDFRNFYAFEGLSTDSYALSIGEVGQFTGCISYQGYPTFFKENRIYRIMGGMPSEYALNEISAPGVQQGSSKSLVIVSDYLIYKAVSDVMIFDGSRPRSISDQLGSEAYYDGIAGGNNNKYYIELRTTLNAPVVFVYDILKGLWHKESDINAKAFSVSNNGDLFAITEYNLIGIGDKNNSAYARSSALDEEFVRWMAESGSLGIESPEFKNVDRISIRAYVPFRSEVQVEISYDGRPYDKVGTIRGNDDIQSQTMTINPFRCDNFKIRLSGHGYVRIYSLAITMDTESEENGYKF